MTYCGFVRLSNCEKTDKMAFSLTRRSIKILRGGKKTTYCGFVRLSNCEKTDKMAFSLTRRSIKILRGGKKTTYCGFVRSFIHLSNRSSGPSNKASCKAMHREEFFFHSDGLQGTDCNHNLPKAFRHREEIP